MTSADEEIVNRVEELAKKKGWQMSHVALVWLKSKGAVPIVGLNSVEKVEDVCEMKGKLLTDEELSYLEGLYAPKPVAGHL
jgi:Predicted oxidoreductases (related to aryl-alcohol dehydrogenases)